MLSLRHDHAALPGTLGGAARPLMMKAYLINMAAATERLRFVSEQVARLGITMVRVEAINGRQLPEPYEDYSPRFFMLKHGKRTNPAEIGCYFSHIKALRAFLATGDDHGLILEDDVAFASDAWDTIAKALRHAADWDILRLSALHDPVRVKVRALGEHHALYVDLTKQTGAGAYFVNRRAAQVLVQRLLPMSLPYDHAFDHEWSMGLVSLSLHPIIADQKGVEGTQINASNSYKLPGWRRYWSTIPYRACMEAARFVCRSILALRLRCFRPAASP